MVSPEWIRTTKLSLSVRAYLNNDDSTEREKRLGVLTISSTPPRNRNGDNKTTVVCIEGDGLRPPISHNEQFDTDYRKEIQQRQSDIRFLTFVDTVHDDLGNIGDGFLFETSQVDPTFSNTIQRAADAIQRMANVPATVPSATNPTRTTST